MSVASELHQSDRELNRPTRVGRAGPPVIICSNAQIKVIRYDSGNGRVTRGSSGGERSRTPENQCASR